MATEPPLEASWVNEFMHASQGPSTAALRPYFDDTVRPYYGMPSADWAAIERDKTNYFKRFPTIHMTVVGQPQIRSTDQGKAVDATVTYANIKSDGQAVQGTTKITMNVRLVGGAWKIAGIQEAVGR